MTLLRISIPVYKRNSWSNLSEQGIIEVSTGVDSDILSESYDNLKPQIEDLLLKMQSESRIVIELQELDLEINKRRGYLRNLIQKIDVAKAQLQRLEKFLRRLGIDPTSFHLEISSNPSLDVADESVAVEAEVDPIPFNSFDSDSNPHEF